MQRIPFTIILLAVLLPALHVCGQDSNVKPLLDRARYNINKGSADSALILADEILKLARQNHDTASLIRALSIKGKAVFKHGKNKEAVENYFEALRLCKSPADDKQIAYLYSDIGYTYFSQELFAEAISYYEKELPIRKALGQKKETCDALINIAGMTRHQKNYAKALAALEEVRTILQVSYDTATEGYYYINKGVILEVMGQQDSAAYCYHKAYDIWKLLNREDEIFKVTYNIGYLAQEKKNYREALGYYDIAIGSAKKFGLVREIAHVYGTMAEAYAGLHEYEKAYDCLYKYANLSDSISKSDFNNYVVKLDKQFQTEKNKETIQDQQLRLNTANLEVQQQRSKVLLAVLILVAVVLIAVVIFGYLSFKNRVQKKVDEAKNRFFANVAHEIRTPLSMIQGPVKVLQEKISDPALLHQLDIAERNTTRLNDLITQMLDLSKIDAAAYRLNERVGKLDDFIKELADQYKAQAAAKNINFAWTGDLYTGNLIFDQDALDKIIGNLLSNAIKYTPAGGNAGMDVTTRQQPGGTLMLQVAVWDTGTGISKDDQAKIFDRFYRAEAHNQIGIKGIGIGLSLVKDLVVLMGGSIAVDSEAGRGAVFTVDLPLRAAITTAAAVAADAVNYTVLLVEDDKDILDFNKTLLTGKGYTVLTGSNGEEAMTVLKDALPDIVVTDLMMPEKDGITLLKEMRANTATDHIPVIILSAKSAAPVRMEGVNEGAQAYLAKPFLPAELAGLIHNQLQLLQKQKERYQHQATQKDQNLEERFAGSDPFTRKCFATIQEHLDDATLSVEMLADLMNINRSHFQRKIKTLTGYSPSELIRTIRLEKALELLLKREGNITEIAYATGFTAQSYFTKCFSEHFGYPPSQALHQQ